MGRKSKFQATSDTRALGRPLLIPGLEARGAIMYGLSEREVGPSDIVEVVNEHEDRGKDSQSPPESKIVYQRVV